MSQPTKQEILEYELDYENGEEENKIVIRCHCESKCGRRLEVRDEELWFVDTVLKIEEKVTSVGTGWVNFQYSMGPVALAKGRKLFRELWEKQIDTGI